MPTMAGPLYIEDAVMYLHHMTPADGICITEAVMAGSFDVDAGVEYVRTELIQMSPGALPHTSTTAIGQQLLE